MPFGLSVPKIFQRKPKIAALLKEAELIECKELDDVYEISRLFKKFSEILEKPNEKYFRQQVEKEYADEEKTRILRPILLDFLGLIRRVRKVILDIIKNNRKALENIKQLNMLFIEKNLRRIRPKGKVIADFEQACFNRLRHKQAIGSLLEKSIKNLDYMAENLEKGVHDLENFDASGLANLFEIEKHIFGEEISEEAKILGMTKESLEGLLRLENLSELIYEKEFFSKKERAKKFLKWDRRILITAKIYISFYAGFQVLLPGFVASIDLNVKDSNRIAHPQIHEKLKNNIKNVMFRAEDGRPSYAELIKNAQNLSTKKAIIFVPGRANNATILEPYINLLRDNTTGIDFLSLSTRGSGPGNTGNWYDINQNSMGANESFDVVGALNYMAELGYTEVVVYGYSIGGAASLIAIGNHSNKISQNIEVKGIIVEKPFADVKSFLERNHRAFSSNLGRGYYNAVGGKEYDKSNMAAPSGFQFELTQKVVEGLGGYKFSDNRPAEAAGRIKAPILAIGTEEGDVYMIPQDAQTIASSAQSGTALIVHTQYQGQTLRFKHDPEFGNQEVINGIFSFLKNNF